MRTTTAVLSATLLLIGVLLAGCASSPGIPETTYYRLPERTPVAALPEPLFELPLVVETFQADGLHSDQALLYALDGSGTQLRGYHYQLWVDPPVRALQRRLMDALRDAHIAPLVVDRLPAHAGSVRVSGRIEALERIPAGDGWKVSVAIGLRVDLAGQERPLLVRTYREQLPAADATVAASVQGIGTAIDRIFAAFVTDLVTAATATGAADVAADAAAHVDVDAAVGAGAGAGAGADAGVRAAVGASADASADAGVEAVAQAEAAGPAGSGE